jgi:hypothetical protein
LPNIRPKPAAKPAKYRPRAFQAKLLHAFAGYIRNCGLVVHDKQLLAAMVCDLAPHFNTSFDSTRFLDECGLKSVMIQPNKENAQHGPVR